MFNSGRAIFGLTFNAILVVFFVVLLLSGGLLSASQAANLSPQKGPIRWAYYVNSATSLEGLRTNVDNLTMVSPYFFVLRSDGTISGNDQAEVTKLAHSHGVKVLPMLQNDQLATSKEGLHNLLADPNKVRQIIDEIETQVLTYGYDGYHIDFENVLAQDRPYLTQFMSNLYVRLHKQGKLVTMAVAAKYRDVTSSWGGSYDYAGLAPYLDYVVPMAYDYSYPGGRDGPVAPINWVNSVAAYAGSQFGPGKVLLGVPFYGYDWNISQGGLARAHSYDNMLQLLQRFNAAASFDEQTQEAWADYTENGSQHRVWFDTPRSLAARLDVIKRNNLGGFAAWRLGQEGRDFWPVISRWQ